MRMKPPWAEFPSSESATPGGALTMQDDKDYKSAPAGQEEI